MDMVEELPSKEWLEVEDMDMEHIDMMEDRTMEVEVVEREHKGVVLARHCIGELIGNGRSLQSRGVHKVTPRLHVWTPIVRHCVEWRREWKWDEI
jgi:hypothetical protein